MGGPATRPHREIARWVAEHQGVEPLAWNARAVAGSFERARGLRDLGQRADGLTVWRERLAVLKAELEGAGTMRDLHPLAVLVAAVGDPPTPAVAAPP